MNQVYVADNELDWLLLGLAQKLLEHRNKYKAVVGIANGGLTISNYVSRIFGWPREVITIRLRDGKHEVDIAENISKLERPFLLVDDIVDSGATLRCFKEHGYVQGTDFDVATLHWCPENSGGEKPDFYVKTKQASEWLTYPWELQTKDKPTC